MVNFFIYLFNLYSLPWLFWWWLAQDYRRKDLWKEGNTKQVVAQSLQKEQACKAQKMRLPNKGLKAYWITAPGFSMGFSTVEPFRLNNFQIIIKHEKRELKQLSFMGEEGLVRWILRNLPKVCNLLLVGRPSPFSGALTSPGAGDKVQLYNQSAFRLI